MAKKLPRPAGHILVPLVISMINSGVVSFLSTARARPVDHAFLGIWTHSWMLSWMVAFPVLLIILHPIRRFVARIAEM